MSYKHTTNMQILNMLTSREAKPITNELLVFPNKTINFTILILFFHRKYQVMAEESVGGGGTRHHNSQEVSLGKVILPLLPQLLHL